MTYLCSMKVYLISGINNFDDNFINKCCSFFPRWRKEQMMSYKYLRGKVQNCLAYLLLVHALREEGVFTEMPEFCYNEHGKPSLKNYPDWYFNFSHCKDAVCCVIAKEEVGIDIEEVREYKESLAMYSCDEKEIMMLKRSDDIADDFYMLWTRKEAAFKLIGSGITKEIKHILDNTHINIVSEKIDNMWLSIATYKH